MRKFLLHLYIVENIKLDIFDILPANIK